MTKNIQFIVKDPPRILSFNLSPSTFNSLGGNVTASVKASSDVGVGEARLIITRPDGTQTAIPRIPYNAATGEYSYSWILPGNSTSSPMTFGVQARVYDTGGTMTGSQVISVTVPAKAADTLRLPVPTLMPRFP